MKKKLDKVVIQYKFLEYLKKEKLPEPGVLMGFLENLIAIYDAEPEAHVLVTQKAIPVQEFLFEYLYPNPNQYNLYFDQYIMQDLFNPLEKAIEWTESEYKDYKDKKIYVVLHESELHRPCHLKHIEYILKNKLGFIWIWVVYYQYNMEIDKMFNIMEQNRRWLPYKVQHGEGIERLEEGLQAFSEPITDKDIKAWKKSLKTIDKIKLKIKK